MSLLDVLRGVMLDPAEQAAYNADPGAYLERYGYDDVEPADLSEAFGLVADTLPPDQAQAAWSAATEPDDGSFGAVTADFDGDAGIVDAGMTVPDANADLEADIAAAKSESGEADADPEPELSFGRGEDDGAAYDAVVPPRDDRFGDDDFGDLSPGEPEAGQPPGEVSYDVDVPVVPARDDRFDDDQDELDAGRDADLDDDAADGFAAGGLHGDAGSGLDPLDGTDTGLDADAGLDDTDDLAEIEGLGGVDDQGPDDLDIGSF